MTEQIAFDFAAAKAGRDAGIASVTQNAGNWMDQARAAAWKMPLNWTGTGEDLRVHLYNAGLPHAHHHNAWGALIRGLIQKSMLQEIGMTHMRTAKSHARKTPLYRKIK